MDKNENDLLIKKRIVVSYKFDMLLLILKF